VYRRQGQECAEDSKEESQMRIHQQAFRVYADKEHFDELITFYEGLQGIACERRVRIAETGVEAAKVGGFLLLARRPAATGHSAACRRHLLSRIAR
jgi:hypothetical protein